MHHRHSSANCEWHYIYRLHIENWRRGEEMLINWYCTIFFMFIRVLWKMANIGSWADCVSSHHHWNCVFCVRKCWNVCLFYSQTHPVAEEELNMSMFTQRLSKTQLGQNSMNELVSIIIVSMKYIIQFSFICQALFTSQTKLKVIHLFIIWILFKVAGMLSLSQWLLGWDSLPGV